MITTRGIDSFLKGVRPKAKIVKAAVRIGGHLYTGTSHPEAMKKAKKQGHDISKVDREKEGRFVTSDGRVINRSQAKKEFGITHSEEVPHLLKGRFKAKKNIRTKDMLHNQFGYPINLDSNK